jgi:hypothetical protein
VYPVRLVLKSAPVTSTFADAVLLVPAFVSQPVAKLVGEAAFGYFKLDVFWSNQRTVAALIVPEIVSAEVGEASLPAGYAVTTKSVLSHALGIPLILMPAIPNFGVVAVFL